MKRAFFILLAIAMLLPNATYAETYTTGTLIKSETAPGVYYIGSDGKKYGFPNGETFRSWYTNFSRVRTVSNQEFDSIPNGSTYVTVKPGTKLVKFKNSPKVYAVENGAVIRWLPTEDLAKEVYGPNWSKNIIEFSDTLLGSYRLGEDLRNAANYIKDNVRSFARAVDNELRSRFAIIETNNQQRILSNALYRPKLLSLYSDFNYPLEPRFNENWTLYRLNLPPAVKTVFLRPTPSREDAKIDVNGTPAEPNEVISLLLKDGSNRITTTVSDPVTGSSTPYTIIAFREKKSIDATLGNIRGNLAYDFVPNFHPQVLEYTIRAGYGQAFWEFTPETRDEDSIISIDGIPVNSGRIHTVPLDRGENKVKILVTALNGKRVEYNITVSRDRYPILDATNLSNLFVNLRDSSNLNFDPDKTIYNVRAQSDEREIGITAYAKYRDAYVVIDGEQTTDKFVRLSPGENEIEIFVQLLDGLEKRYELNVYREVE